jgi:hypothetical protein
MPDAQDKAQFCEKMNFAFPKDGRTIEMQFLRRNGKTAYVPCEFDKMAHIVLAIEEAIGKAYKIQQDFLGGNSPSAFYPVPTRKVQRIEAGVSKGQLVLMFEMSTGLRLNLTIDQQKIQKMIDDLEEVKQRLPITKTPARH